MFLLTKLPAAFFSGIKIISCNQEKCVTSVPYKWLTRNPFRSTYFASLAMAAEMSTGVLAMSNIYKRNPSVSMLVVGMRADYFKKATGITIFTCADGETIAQAVNKAIQTGESTSILATSNGLDREGNKVAQFEFTWSFKVKSA